MVGSNYIRRAVLVADEYGDKSSIRARLPCYWRPNFNDNDFLYTACIMATSDSLDPEIDTECSPIRLRATLEDDRAVVDPSDLKMAEFFSSGKRHRRLSVGQRDFFGAQGNEVVIDLEANAAKPREEHV